MCECSYPGCDAPAHKHHIVFRSHGGLDNELNLKPLCAFHHELDKDSPHRCRATDLKYKAELQDTYYEIFEDRPYSVSEIAQIIGLSLKKTEKAFLKVPNVAGEYEKEDIIRRLMGGRLY